MQDIQNNKSRKRKVLLFTTLVIVGGILLLLGGYYLYEKSRPDPTIGLKNTQGNTSGNTFFYGQVVQTKDWIYFHNKDGIYRMKPDGSFLSLVHKGLYTELNIINNDLYYVILNDVSDTVQTRRIYKQNIDTKEEIFMCEYPHSISESRIVTTPTWIVDGWVYYSISDNFSKDFELQRVRIDGKYSNTIAKGISSTFTPIMSVYKNYLFYYNTDTLSDGNEFTSVNVDGSGSIVINSDFFHIECINIVDDWIYFTGVQGKNNERKILELPENKQFLSLYKMRLDGSKLTLIKDDVLRFNIFKDSIYYVPYNGVRDLWKMDLAGDNRKEIYPKEILNDPLGGGFDFYLTDDWIFFTPYDESATAPDGTPIYNIFCRMHHDGSGLEVVGE